MAMVARCRGDIRNRPLGKSTAEVRSVRRTRRDAGIRRTNRNPVAEFVGMKCEKTWFIITQRQADAAGHHSPDTRCCRGAERRAFRRENAGLTMLAFAPLLLLGWTSATGRPWRRFWANTRNRCLENGFPGETVCMLRGRGEHHG